MTNADRAVIAAIALLCAIALFLVGISIHGCSGTLPTLPVSTPTPALTPVQVAQQTITCVEQSVVPCLSQPPPLNSPQLCMALAASACLQKVQ